MTNEEIEIRVAQLEELASLTDTGAVLDSAALRGLAYEYRRATQAVEMMDTLYPVPDEPYDQDDPKHEGYHSLHADIWDQRFGK